MRARQMPASKINPSSRHTHGPNGQPRFLCIGPVNAATFQSMEDVMDSYLSIMRYT